jgi:hypothetical protein
MNDKEKSTSLEQYQITRFVDDVVPTTYVKPAVAQPSDWMKEAEEMMPHNIKDILQRPVEVSSGTFSDTFSGVTIDFPSALIGASANLKSKLDYFEFFRADIHVKVVFNATPFQQGKYWVFFSPYDSVSGRGSTGTLPNATGYPGTEIDIASGASVELQIPYCAPLSHYRLTNGEGQMGELKIVPIQNLASGIASDSAAFTVFAWFENIELTMPTRLVAQMDEEEVKTESSTIRAIAEGVGSVASAFVEAVPPLAPLAKPLGWVQRAVSGTLSAFGFNKPTSEHQNCPYANLPGKGYTAMDGVDLSTKLAAAPDNNLVTKSGIFSSSVDEMDIDFVKSKSCIVFEDVTWDTTQAAGSILKRWANSPCSVEGSIAATISPTTLTYLTSMFGYWRGGIKYRLSVVKTAFHTGRLRVSFIPSSTGTIPVLPTNLEFCHNWILDLSKSSELEFTVPYMNNVPWCRTAILPGDSLVMPGVLPAATGYLVFEVLTPLRAASTNVVQSVSLVLWHSGDKTFELAAPEFSLAFVDQDPDLLEAQIWNDTEEAITHNEQMVDTSTPMFGAPEKGFTLPEELSIGEKITSLRQLIKRFGEVLRGTNFPYNNGTSTASPGPQLPGVNDLTRINKVAIDPIYLGEKDSSGEVSQNFNLPTGFDVSGASTGTAGYNIANARTSSVPLHYISFLFRFWRGSKRYKMFLPEYTAPAGFGQRVGTTNGKGMRFESDRFKMPLVVKRLGGPVSNIVPVSRPNVLNSVFGVELPESSQFEHTIYPDLNGVAEFEVPYYSNLPISVVADEGVNDTTVGPMFTRSLLEVQVGLTDDSLDVPSIEYVGDGSPNMNLFNRGAIGAFRLMEAAGDDFSFGYLVGAPAIRLRTP